MTRITDVPLRRHQLIAVHPQRAHDSPWVVYGLVIHVQEDGAGIEAADPYWPKQVPFSEWLAMTQHRPATNLASGVSGQSLKWALSH